MIRSLIIYLFLIIFLIQFKPKIAVNILIIAPNKYKSHFNFHKSIAFSLINQQWVTNVTMLVVEDNPNNRDNSLNNINKLSILNYPTYNREEQILNINTFLQTNQGGQSPNIRRQQQQRRKFCDYLRNCFNNSENKNYERYFLLDAQIFFNMAKNIELINALCQQNYFIGMAELYDYPIIPFLQFIRCQNIIATSYTPLQSIYYEYLGVLPQIIENGNIPVMNISINEQRSQGFAFYHNLGKDDMEHNINLIDKIYKNISKEIGFNNKPKKFEYLIKNVIKYIFVNNQPFIDFEINKPEKVINIGGITFPLSNEQLLNEQELNYFNEAYQNNKQIILVSFGTVKDNYLTNEQIENIAATFNLFEDYLFIWKVEQEYHQIILNNNNNNNIRLINWINQNAILPNPNTILFISHCGMNSTLEAIKYGKSLICIPFMFDQFYISEALEHRGVAIVVSKENNFEDLYDKIVGGISGNERMNELTNQINSINSVQVFLNKIYELI